jgi:hypothetical protein
MTRKRIQNKISESRFAFPTAALYSVFIWLACGLFTHGWWLSFLLMIVTSYFMVEVNNQNALIRIYSRMVSCSFLAFSVMENFLFGNNSAAATGLCFAGFFLMFFKTYQHKDGSTPIFYAFIYLGILSFFSIQILYLLPIIWILLTTKIMAWSWRNFWSSLLGIFMPYWFLEGYYIYIGKYRWIINHLMGLISGEHLFDWTIIDIPRRISFIWLTLLALIGIIHFLTTSYKDSIKVRMFYESFITMDIAVFLLILIFPNHYDELITIFTVSTSPIIAHYIALTRGKVNNIVFIFIMIITLLITIFNMTSNLWTHLFHF